MPDPHWSRRHREDEEGVCGGVKGGLTAQVEPILSYGYLTPPSPPSPRILSGQLSASAEAQLIKR